MSLAIYAVDVSDKSFASWKKLEQLSLPLHELEELLKKEFTSNLYKVISGQSYVSVIEKGTDKELFRIREKKAM